MHERMVLESAKTILLMTPSLLGLHGIKVIPSKTNVSNNTCNTTWRRRLALQINFQNHIGLLSQWVRGVTHGRDSLPSDSKRSMEQYVAQRLTVGCLPSTLAPLTQL